jgi:redox-sensitive bicupin YhaK (pirin superfamily)
VRQRRDTHSGRNHLNQQQGVIHAFQLWANACGLQEVTPDIQAAALHRVNQQRFRRQIFRRDARFTGQRVIRSQHQAHFKIKHRRIVQTTARQNV